MYCDWCIRKCPFVQSCLTVAFVGGSTVYGVGIYPKSHLTLSEVPLYMVWVYTQSPT